MAPLEKEHHGGDPLSAVSEEERDEELAKLSALLERQAMERQRITRRLILAGTATFPVILIVNALLLSIIYGMLERVLPSVAATTATLFAASSLLMGVALAYATLPLLASFGYRLRESF